MTLEEIKAEMKLRRKKKMHPKEEKKKSLSKYFTKFFITVIITLVLLISLKGNKSFQTFFYNKVYENYFNFSKLNETYQKYFGTSIPFSGLIKNETKSVFKEDLVYQNKEQYEEGVKLKVGSEYLVPVLNSGMVVFIGDKENYGNTVIIQQIDGKDVWYSNIKNVNVELYDYVEKGSLLGEVNDDTLILVFKKDGKVLDYEEELS
jgi:stage IV sporulation protein FA